MFVDIVPDLVRVESRILVPELAASAAENRGSWRELSKILEVMRH